MGTVPHLSLVTQPDSTLVALRADEACDVFTISDEMLARGWFVQPQMAFGPHPPSVHLSFSAATAPHVADFVAALRDSVAAAVAAGPGQVAPDLAAAATAIDPDTLDDGAFVGLLRVAGLAGPGGELVLPERMAPVNALLNVAPPRLREALLVAFLDRLSRP
jgi:hypothetical protein